MKYIIAILITAFVVYNAVYFKPLDEKLSENKVETFDAVQFVDDIWEKELIPVFNEAKDVSELIDELQRNPQQAFKQNGRALGIGNIGYFKVKGLGIISSVNENNVLLTIDNKVVELETEFIFGNAVRDASGLIKVNDYDNTSDFNSISEAINAKIRETVVSRFRSNIKLGSQVDFEGALELNKAHLHIDTVEVIPVSLKIIQ